MVTCSYHCNISVQISNLCARNSCRRSCAAAAARPGGSRFVGFCVIGVSYGGVARYVLQVGVGGYVGCVVGQCCLHLGVV